MRYWKKRGSRENIDMKSQSLPSPVKWFFEIAVVAFLYYGTARLALTLAFEHTNASPVWPPSGIAFAAVLFFGYRIWPGILLGAFLANALTFRAYPWLDTGTILAVSSAIAAGNMLEAMTGKFFLDRMVASSSPFDRARDVFKFVLAAFTMCMVGASIGPVSVCLSGIASWIVFPTIWFTWWLGDSVGILVFTPLLLGGLRGLRIRWRFRPVAEALGISLLLIFLSGVIFSGVFLNPSAHYPLEYLFIPILIFAAFRFGLAGFTITNFLVSVAAIRGTIEGFGPFVRETLHPALLLLQAYIGTISVTGLFLSAVLRERRRAEEDIQKANAALESRVAERTRELLFMNESFQKEILERKRAEGGLQKAYRDLERSQDAALNIMEDLDRQKKELEKANKELSRQIAERERVEQALQRKNLSMMMLQVIAIAANQAVSVEDALQICLDEVCSHTDWVLGHAYRVADNKEELISTGIWNSGDLQQFKEFRKLSDYQHFLPDEGLVGAVFRTGKPRWMEDVTKAADFLRTPAAEESGLLSGFAFPVMAGSDVVMVVEFFSSKIIKPDPSFLEIMTHIGAQVGRVMERSWAQKALEKAYDELEMRVEERTRELKEANEKLKQLDQMKSDFIMTASHELRTPLTSIKGYITLLLQEKVGPLAATQHEFLTHVKNATDRLHRLLNELLSIQKIESGQVAMQMEKTDVANLLEEEVSIFKAQAEQKQIALTLNMVAKLEPVFCDSDRIREVIDNLLSNALKYTPRNGWVRVQAKSHNGELEVEVQDSGIGIKLEDQAKIFDPFQHLRKTGLEGEESTGLGLALSRRIVEAHQGKITVKSEEGKGSTFTMILPR